MRACVRAGKAYMGKGVTKAVANVNTAIAKALAGQDVTQQAAIDKVRAYVCLRMCVWLAAIRAVRCLRIVAAAMMHGQTKSVLLLNPMRRLPLNPPRS